MSAWELDPRYRVTFMPSENLTLVWPVEEDQLLTLLAILRGVGLAYTVEPLNR